MKQPPTMNESLLKACCKLIDNHTVLVERYHDAPLKITKTFREPDSNALMLYMMDVSPGMMEGDHYRLNIKLKHNAHLVLTNQSFTKIHPATTAGATLQGKFVLEAGACLEYMPEPTIPYHNSKFEGRNEFHLTNGAALIYAEILTSGRTHRNECYQFHKYSSATEIYLDGKLVAYDRYMLTPSVHHYTDIGVLEHYTHQAVMWIFHPQVKEAFLVKLRERLDSYDQSKVLAAVSMASIGGAVIRMLAYTVWELQLLCEQLWEQARIELLDLKKCQMRK